MGNSINFKQSGGTANIGSIVQGGDGSVNNVNSTVSDVDLDRALGDAKSQVIEHARQTRRSDAEVRDVMRHFEALHTAAKEKNPDQEKGTSILETVRKNFSWAYPLMKDFVSIAWPVLLTGLHL